MVQTDESKIKRPVKRSAGKLGQFLRKRGLLAYVPPNSVATKTILKRSALGLNAALVVTSKAASAKNLRKWGSHLKRQALPEVRAEDAALEASIENAEIQIDASAYAPNSRARALLKGCQIASADLHEAGGAFELEQVQALLNGVSRQAIEKRVKEGSLLAVPGPSNRRRYPTVQFTRDGLVPGLKEVQNALPTRNPWAVLNFFVRPDDRLGGRKPIDVLRLGDVQLVVSAAQGVGSQGG